MPADFGAGWLNYFQIVSDATWFVQLFFYSAMLIVLDLPKKWDRNSILITIAKFLGVYLLYYFTCGLIFSLRGFIANMTVGDIIYNASPIIVVVAYIAIFLKEGFLQRFIKFSFIASGILLTAQMGKNLGMVMGEWTNDNFACVFLARSFPTLFCVLIAYITWRYEIKNIRQLPKAIVIVFILLAYVLMVIASWENYLTARFHTQDSADVVSLYLLFVSLYIVTISILSLLYYAFYYIDAYREKMLESELRYSLSEAENEAIKLNEAKLEEFRKFRHDLKNQLSYLSVLLDEGKQEEAKGYLEELNAVSANLSQAFVCSNKTISSIINLELSKAKAMGIKVNLNVVVPPVLPFADLDLVSLISNLVDNALENYDHESDKGVTISIFNYQDYLRLSVSNPIKKEDEQKAAKLISKKGVQHGYGSKVIRSIAAQYSGHASFSAEEGSFIADVILYLDSQAEVKKDA